MIYMMIQKIMHTQLNLIIVFTYSIIASNYTLRKYSIEIVKKLVQHFGSLKFCYSGLVQLLKNLMVIYPIDQFEAYFYILT